MSDHLFPRSRQPNELVKELEKLTVRILTTQHELHVLEAMRCVPREAFVPKGLEEFAYDDSPLPIGEGQTISQPYIVALMTRQPS